YTPDVFRIIEKNGASSAEKGVRGKASDCAAKPAPGCATPAKPPKAAEAVRLCAVAKKWTGRGGKSLTQGPAASTIIKVPCWVSPARSCAEPAPSGATNVRT